MRKQREKKFATSVEKNEKTTEVMKKWRIYSELVIAEKMERICIE